MEIPQQGTPFVVLVIVVVMHVERCELRSMKAGKRESTDLRDQQNLRSKTSIEVRNTLLTLPKYSSLIEYKYLHASCATLQTRTSSSLLACLEVDPLGLDGGEQHNLSTPRLMSVTRTRIKLSSNKGTGHHPGEISAPEAGALPT